MGLNSEPWRKSSRSSQANECVEVATSLSRGVGVRDSKDPAGPVLSFDAYAWRVFVAAPPRRT
ncbi:DUF397 domain-containing protein [Verrucosispora sp. WMMD703]|uniref:DUF397 domain-containing protein n=1 Tax=Verrucosispora sp. WMMD703 TaxID=3403463 RepID=UPI003B926004